MYLAHNPRLEVSAAVRLDDGVAFQTRQKALLVRVAPHDDADGAADVLQPREAPASARTPVLSLWAAQCSAAPVLSIRFATSHGIQCDSQGGSGIASISCRNSTAGIPCRNSAVQLHFMSCNSAAARRCCSSAAPRCTRHAPATLAALFSAVPLSAPPLPRDLPHATATSTTTIAAAAR